MHAPHAQIDAPSQKATLPRAEFGRACVCTLMLRTVADPDACSDQSPSRSRVCGDHEDSRRHPCTQLAAASRASLRLPSGLNCGRAACALTGARCPTPGPPTPPTARRLDLWIISIGRRADIRHAPHSRSPLGRGSAAGRPLRSRHCPAACARTLPRSHTL